MAKTNLTKELEHAIMKEKSDCFGCLEVTIGWYGEGRVDFMTMDCKEIFRCFEIKISKSDFRSKHGHNFVGHFNYYVLPEELYKEVKDEIPKAVGVYTWNGACLSLSKRPKKQELTVDINVLKNSLIRSLYRDACKVRNSEDVKKMNNLKKELSRTKKISEQNSRYYLKYKNAIYSELGRVKFREFQEKYDL